MKTFAIALSALTFATAAHAASPSAHERPELFSPNRATNAQTIEVPAGTVMTSTELTRAGMKATDPVMVTRVGDGSEHHDRFSSRGDN